MKKYIFQQCYNNQQIFKIQAMKQTIFFIFLISIIMTAKLQRKVLPKPSNTLTQANHFFSDSKLFTKYDINKVKINTPLVFVLRPSKDQTSLQNPIEITLNSDSKSTTCKFNSFNNLCVLKQVVSQKMQLQIKCERLPCEASWTIYQSNSKMAVQQQNLEDLFQIQSYDKHTIVMLHCNNPEIKNLQTQLKVYANGDFKSTFSNGIRYLLFEKLEKGYIYTKSTAQIKACTQMSIFKGSNVLKQNVLIKDFITKAKTTYKLNDVPKDIFRIDNAIHALEKQHSIRDDLIIVLTGQKDNKRVIIQNATIHPLPVLSFDFSYVFNKVDESYKNLQIEFASSDNMIMLSTRLSESSISEVDKNELSFFSLKKGQKIPYSLLPESSEDAKQKGFIQLSDKNKLKTDKQECSIKQGCKFTIQAIQDVQYGNIFISNTKQSTSRRDQVQAEYDIDKQATKKINEGDIHFFKKVIPKERYVQVVVNSPNVILYASNQTKCPKPHEQCYQKIGNNHHPFIYQAKQQITLIIAVRGLDTCEYTLTIMDDNAQFVQLQDSVAFSYLMDDKQTDVVFRFTAPSKQHDISFNLISPLHATYLIVSNSQNIPTGQQKSDQLSMDGYILFQKKYIKKNVFTISVVKNELYSDKFVHFTIIASSKQTNMRLQPGISHYQTIAMGLSRQFVFQFDKQQKYVLNFYTHNVIAQKLQIKLQVSDKDDNWEDQKVFRFVIDQSADHLDLTDVSEQLCKTEGTSTCQIFVRIVNSMPAQIDITLTLMVEHSIIQLKDGLWQSFTANQISTSSHFYFFPTDKETSTSIMYKSTLSDLRISYAIWKAQDKTINPVKWPFPQSTIDFTAQGEQYAYRPVKHINIAKQAYQQCWPSCVILISIVQDSSTNRFIPLNANLQSYSILISNDLIQIPQSSKIDITLEKDQEKFFLFDLKYAMQRQVLTVFSEATLGYPQIYASLYTDTNPRCPTQMENDFSLGRLQTQINISSIKNKLTENGMDGDRSVYMCLMAKSWGQAKFYIEWSSEQQLIKVLELDSFETIKLQPPSYSSKTFQITPRNQQYQLKFIRTRGFPYIKIANCKGQQNQDYEACLSKLQKSGQKRQMLTKTQLFAQQPCQNCIIFIIVESQQPAELQIHVQGKNSQVQLKQNIMQSDFTQKDDINRYILTSVANQQTIINIHVISGDIQVDITDFKGVNMKKQKAQDGQLHIVIPPLVHETAQQAQNKQKIQKIQKIQTSLSTSPILPFQFTSILGLPFNSPFGLHTSFQTFHVSIKSSNPEISSSYSIIYSSGDRQIYLQDGLLAQYTLQPKVKTFFFYHNIIKKSHAYLTISMPQSAALFNLKMQMFYYTDAQDVSTEVQFTPNKPPMRRKTPNPVMLFSFPQDHELYSIVLQNPSETSQKVTLLINHLEVILLPFNYQFPFVLHPNQSLNFLVDVVNTGYLQINARKCDQSTPSFGYTFDQQSFQKQQFSYQTQLTNDPSFQYVVKAQNPGTFFMMVKSSELEQSIMSMKVIYSVQKIKGAKAKPGNRGLLEYQLLNSQQAEITFTGAVCTGKCPSDLVYYTLSDVSMKDLYGQTVCPATFFNTNDLQTMKPLNITKITSKADSQNKITFNYKLLDHISFIGVKAVSASGQQIYYTPIQIVTLWGQLSRTSHSHKLGILLLALLGLCILLILVRRNARKGYKPLDEQND